MADAELRDLERAFAASGAVDDEARWLQALVRAGRLEPERLAAAALLGHDAARRLTGSVAAPRKGVGGWLDHIVRSTWPDGAGWSCVPLGWQLAVRTLVAIAAARPRPPDAEDAMAALQAAEAWCLCPCLECSTRAWNLHGLVRSGGKALAAHTGAARVASTPGGTDIFPGRTWLAHHARKVLTGVGGAKTVWEVAPAELIPWALRRGDPVRDRVEARRG